ncbi:hypothetical protein [Nostoc sp.]|uniref:hypothetical protein n=1 Tax=Nostoc sp. TaxID=1180 RepID=UPI002FFAA59A
MMNFKIQAFFTTLMIGSVSALTISDAISQKVNAQGAPSCNNATIRGSYGTQFLENSKTEQIAVVGLIKFDGNGNFQGNDTLSLNGTIANRTVSGNYDVQPDCTVRMVYVANINGTGFFNGIIVNSGKEIFIVATNPTTVFTGTFKKV